MTDGVEYEFDTCVSSDIKCEFIKNNEVVLTLDNSYYNVFDIYIISDNYYLIISNSK